MSDTAKRRLAIDLDEIERQLQQSAPQRGGAGGHGAGGGNHEHGGASSGKPDPLAELARIVGQDDPFRGILSGERPGTAPRRPDGDQDAVFAFDQGESRRDQAQPAHQGFDDWLPQEQHEAQHQVPHGAAPPQEQPQVPFPAHPQARDEAWPQMPAPIAGHTPQHSEAQPEWQQQDWREEDLYADPHHTGAQAPYPASPETLYQDQPYHEQARQQPAHHHPAHADLGAPPAYAARHPAGQAYGTGQDAYEDYGDTLDDLDAAPRLRRERRGGGKAMMTVGIVLGVAVIGVASALYFVRSTGPAADGEPPLITAESEPMRVEPINPGGVEIPDQDRQIFERSAEDETRVVDREEQPVDVGEIARTSPRVVLPPPAAAQNREGVADPIAQVLSGTMETQSGFDAAPEVSAAVAELGEPRRVRTVTVRPDGTIIRNGDDAPRQTASLDTPSEFTALADANIPAPATERMPWEPEPGAETNALQDLADAPAQNSATNSTTESVQASQNEAPPAPAPREPMALTGATQIAPQAQQQSAAAQSPQQTASVAPSQPAATGDYVVQLGISNSEDRAQAAFNQFRDRYASIIGDANPIVRRAEVNGNTIYRVRVGPYDLSSANSVCDRIKDAGGDCFVARN
jgi:hypothetical protein